MESGGARFFIWWSEKEVMPKTIAQVRERVRSLLAFYEQEFGEELKIEELGSWARFKLLEEKDKAVENRLNDLTGGEVVTLCKVVEELAKSKPVPKIEPKPKPKLAPKEIPPPAPVESKKKKLINDKKVRSQGGKASGKRRKASSK